MVFTSGLWIRKNHYQVKCYLKDRPSQKKIVFTFPIFIAFLIFKSICLFRWLLFPASSSIRLHSSPSCRAMHFTFTCQPKFSLWYFQIVSCLRCPLFLASTFRKGAGNKHWGIIFVCFPRKVIEGYHCSKIISVIITSFDGCKECNGGAQVPRTVSERRLTISLKELLSHHTFTKSEDTYHLVETLSKCITIFLTSL